MYCLIYKYLEILYATAYTDYRITNQSYCFWECIVKIAMKGLYIWPTNLQYNYGRYNGI